ncbi:HNH endonuclease [Streptomyces venezuelae]|uniref:HNH endonuclease n=1 Tax=Streptomyces sp. B6(2022) TaxID=3404749 RepID=UPI00311D8A40
MSPGIGASAFLEDHMLNPCPYCGDQMSNARRKQCGKPICKKAFNAERMREWQRNYKAKHGQWYTRVRHGEAQRAYDRRRYVERGSSRKLYPAAAVAADARRRMRMEQARTSEVFSPLDVHTRDGWTCRLCQRPIDPQVAWPDPMSVSVDHIVPLSKGGLHAMINVQSAHLGCNSRKGDRLADEAGSMAAVIKL